MSEYTKQTAKLGATLHGFYGDYLSDEDAKTIHDSCDPKELLEAVLETKQPFSRHTAALLEEVLGSENGLLGDDTLKRYADFVKNYHYTYKPEAQSIDTSIDPSEEQIGIMAQDIEKVNPATVTEDAAGYKEVDTGRLALMNAGAIGELAREVAAIKEMLHGMGQ